MSPFDENIISMIDKLSYDLFLIKQDFDIVCPCTNFTTKQANKNCPRCLGTGHKIKIKKIRGTWQTKEQSIGLESVSEFVSVGTYYIKRDYPIEVNNLIVRGNNVDVVTMINAMGTNNVNPVYYKCEAKPKKSNVKEFFKNFNRIVGVKYG